MMFLDKMSGEYRVVVLGDFSGWIGNRKRGEKTRAFGEARENENDSKAIEFCEPKEMFV